jgi:hypothetical protein
MADTVKVTLNSTYNYHDGKSYGPGETEVPVKLAQALGLEPVKSTAKSKKEADKE